MKGLKKKIKRGLAAMLAFCLTMTSVPMDAWASELGSLGSNDALFMMSGEDLRESAQAAVEDGNAFHVDDLEMAEGSVTKKYEKAFDTGTVYEFSPAMDIDSEQSDIELRMFVQVKGDAEDYQLTGDEKIMLLFVNMSDEKMNFLLEVDGELKAKATVKGNSFETEEVPSDGVGAPEIETTAPAESTEAIKPSEPEETAAPEESTEANETEAPTMEDSTEAQETEGNTEAPKEDPTDAPSVDETNAGSDSSDQGNTGSNDSENSDSGNADSGSSDSGNADSGSGDSSNTDSGSGDSGNVTASIIRKYAPIVATSQDVKEKSEAPEEKETTEAAKETTEAVIENTTAAVETSEAIEETLESESAADEETTEAVESSQAETAEETTVETTEAPETEADIDTGSYDLVKVYTDYNARLYVTTLNELGAGVPELEEGTYRLHVVHRLSDQGGFYTKEEDVILRTEDFEEAGIYDISNLEFLREGVEYVKASNEVTVVSAVDGVIPTVTLDYQVAEGYHIVNADSKGRSIFKGDLSGDNPDIKPIENAVLEISYVYQSGVTAARTDKMEVPKDSSGVGYPVSWEIKEIEGYTPVIKENAEENALTLADFQLTGSLSAKQVYKVVIEYQAIGKEYTVRHHFPKLGEPDTYVIEMESMSGTVGDLTAGKAMIKPGFTAGEIEQKTITPDFSADTTFIDVYYDRNEYILNFDTMGGSYVEYLSGKYEESIAVGTVQETTKEGFAFEGWYRTKDLNPEDKVTDTVTLLGDVTLYANWVPDMVGYRVVYLIQNADDDDYTLLGYDDTWTGETGTTAKLAKGDSKAGEYFVKQGLIPDAFEFDKSTEEIIKADGSTVIAAYYNRKEYTLEFTTSEYSGPYNGFAKQVNGKYEFSNTFRITARYQADISKVWREKMGSYVPATSGYAFSEGYGFKQDWWITDVLVHGKLKDQTYDGWVKYVLATYPDEIKKAVTPNTDINLEEERWYIGESEGGGMLFLHEQEIMPYYSGPSRTKTIPYYAGTGSLRYDMVYYVETLNSAEVNEELNDFQYHAAKEISYVNYNTRPWLVLAPGTVKYDGYELVYTNAKGYVNNSPVGETGSLDWEWKTGWSNGSVTIGSYIQYPKGITKFYYNLKEYTLTLDTGVGAPTDIKCKYTSSITEEIAPPTTGPEGGTFAGWYIDPDFTEKNKSTTMPKNNLILYAKWDYQTHTVKLVDSQSDEEAVPYETFEVKRNEKAPTSEFSTPEKIGYIFTGWYNTKDCTAGDLFNPQTQITKNTTIYAGWKPVSSVSYTIKYQTKDGIEVATADTGTGKPGEKISIKAKMPSDQGYVAEAPSKEFTLTGDANKNVFTYLYSQGGSYEYQVRYLDYDKNVIYTEEDPKTTELSSVTSYPEAFQDLGIEALWGYEPVETYITARMSTSEITYIDFHVTPVTYTITYKGIDGVTWWGGDTNPRNYTRFSEDIILKNPEKAGFVFMGWDYNGEVTGGVSYDKKNVYIEKGSVGDLTFTASWAEIPYLTIDKKIVNIIKADGEFVAKDEISAYTLDLGDIATYEITVKNTGNAVAKKVYLVDTLREITHVSGVEIKDGKSGEFELQPGESVTSEYTYEVKASDLGTTEIVNTAIARIPYDETSGFQGQKVAITYKAKVAKAQAGLSVTKHVTKIRHIGIDYTSGLDSIVVTTGDIISYQVNVQNTGNKKIDNITLTDSLPGIQPSASIPAFSLDARKSMNFNFTYTVVEKDLGKGTIVNVATAQQDEIGTVPSNEATVTVDERRPDMSITKTVTGIRLAGSDGMVPTESLNDYPVNVGDTIMYQVTVKNTGNETLNSIKVTDELEGAKTILALFGIEVSNLKLAPGQSKVITYFYEVKETDLTGTLVNTAKAVGYDSSQTELMRQDTHNQNTASLAPGLSVTKEVTNTGTGAGGAFQVGDTVTYKIAVQNKGNQTLTNLKLVDTFSGKNLSDFNIIPGEGYTVEEDGTTVIIGSLKPGMSVQITSEYKIASTDSGTTLSNKVAVTADHGVTGEAEVTTPVETNSFNLKVVHQYDAGKDLVETTKSLQYGTAIEDVSKKDDAGYRYMKTEIVAVDGVETSGITETDGTVTGNMPFGDLIVTFFYQKEYQLSYNGNATDAVNVPESGAPLVNGESVRLPSQEASPTRPGYTFVGWNTKADGNGENHAAGGTFTMGTGDTVLYAQWSASAVDYKVERYEQSTEDGSYKLAGTSDVRKAPTDSIARVTDDDKKPSGTKFAYVSTSDTVEQAPVAADGSTVLKVYFKLQLKVSYHPGEHGAFLEQDKGTFDYGTKTPGFTGETTADGNYEFAGWSPEINAEVHDDVIYVAQWKATYSVTYVGAEGIISAPTDESRYTAGKNVTVKAPVTVKPGYTFSGWTTSEDGLGTVYPTDGTFTMSEADVILYPQYEADLTGYKVEYYEQSTTDGSYQLIKIDDTRTERTDSTASVTEADKTPSSERFAYAKTDDTVESAAVTADGSTVLKVYFKLQLRVSYEPGAHGSFPAQDKGSFDYGTETPGFTGETTADGNYEFAGWSPEVNAKVHDDVIYVAQWKATYGITYEEAGGIISAPRDEARYTEGKEVKVLAPAEVKPGYTFDGWTLDAEGSGDRYTAGETFNMPGTDVVLYPQYTANTVNYKVEHYLQNLENDSYTLTGDAETLSGKTDSTAIYTASTVSGFAFAADKTEFVSRIDETESETGNAVLADGSLVVKLYYDRNSYDVKVKHIYQDRTGKEIEGLTSEDGSTSLRYGEAVAVAKRPETGYVYHDVKVTGLNDYTSTDLNAVEGIMPPGSMDIIVIYKADIIGPEGPETPDGTPDELQVQVTYQVTNGILEPEIYYTVVDLNEDGVGHLKADQIPAASAIDGYNQATENWALNGTTDTKPTTETEIREDYNYQITFTEADYQLTVKHEYQNRDGSVFESIPSFDAPYKFGTIFNAAKADDRDGYMYYDISVDGIGTDGVDTVSGTVTGNMPNKAVTITFIYKEDRIGTTDPEDSGKPDGIPDEFQAVVDYAVVNGSITIKQAVVTLLDRDGKPSKAGTGYLAENQITQATANTGYAQSSLTWSDGKVPTTEIAITGNTTLTANFDKALYPLKITHEYQNRKGEVVNTSENTKEVPFMNSVEESIVNQAGYVFWDAEISANLATARARLELVRGTMPAEAASIKFIYKADTFGPEGPDAPDGTPDEYQAIITYKANNGTTSHTWAVVNLTDAEGNLAKDGIGRLTHEQIPVATANNGYRQNSERWDVQPTTTMEIKNDITMTVSFTRSGGGDGGGGTGGGGTGGGGPNPGTPSVPGGPGTMQILPENVPLANLPPTVTDAETWVIDDGEVPLAALPKTGDSSASLQLSLLLSSLMAGLYIAFGKKRKENQ